MQRNLRHYMGRIKKRAIWKSQNLFNPHKVFKQNIKQALIELGIKSDDVLFVHSSLSALGYVDGGADSVLDVLLETVGKKGTILMPVYPFRGTTIAYVESKPVFDVINSPSEMGIITEQFRKISQFRSFYPTHSVCSYGVNAEEFVKDHHLEIIPFSKTSPFYKAYEANAKILCIGSNIGHVTIYHIVEELIQFPRQVYIDKIYKIKVVLPNKQTIFVRTKIHNPKYSIYRIDNDGNTLRYLSKIFTSIGILKTISIGRGVISVLDSKLLIDFLIWGATRGYTIYGDLNVKMNPKSGQ